MYSGSVGGQVLTSTSSIVNQGFSAPRSGAKTTNGSSSSNLNNVVLTKNGLNFFNRVSAVKCLNSERVNNLSNLIKPSNYNSNNNNKYSRETPCGTSSNLVSSTQVNNFLPFSNSIILKKKQKY